MKKLLSSIFILGGGLLVAQPTNIGQLELSVTDKYKAQVQEAKKILEKPRYRDTTTAKLPVQYRIQSTPIAVRFQPEEISPARVARVKVPELYQGLARFGYGFYNTPFADLYYNSDRSSKQHYGLVAQHFSTQRGVRDIAYDDNRISRNHLSAYYDHFFRKFTLNTELEANFNKYSFYGLPEQLLPSDSTRGEAPFNWFRSVGFQTGIVESDPKDLGWLRKANVGYRYLWDNYRSHENDFRWESVWDIPAERQNFILELNGSYFQTRFDSIFQGADSSALFDQSFFQFQAKPYITLEKEDFVFDFGLNIFAVSRAFTPQPESDNPITSSSAEVYFFPELLVAYRIVPEVLRFSAGMKGDLQRNTYFELTRQTPFLLPGQASRPTRRLDAFLRLEGLLSSTTSFSLQGGYQQVNDMQLIYRDPSFAADSTPYGLNLRFSNAGIFYASGAINLNWQEKLLLELSGTLRSFDMQSVERPWYLPYFTGRFSGEYRLAEKIDIAAWADFIGPRQAFDQLDQPNLESILPGYVDLNLKMDYHYNSRIMAFVQFTNLLNSQYDIFLGYRAQSINFLMGIGYRF